MPRAKSHLLPEQIAVRRPDGRWPWAACRVPGPTEQRRLDLKATPVAYNRPQLVRNLRRVVLFRWLWASQLPAVITAQSLWVTRQWPADQMDLPRLAIM